MKKILNLMLSAIFLTIILSVLVYSSSTDTIIKRNDGKIECSVILEDIPEGSVIVVSSFKNDRYNESQFRIVTGNTLEKFFVDNETKEVRVFVFENITTLTPITECEKIEIPDSIIDKDWSEWV